MNHEDLIKNMLATPDVAAEYARLELEDFAILDEMLAARKAAGLTQAQIAEKMGAKAPVLSSITL